MAQERPITPEKQLLKLIEDPKTKNLSPGGIKRKGLSLFSFSAFKGRISYFKERLKSRLSEKQAPLDIRAVNGLLQFIVIVLVAYLGINITISVMDLKNIKDVGLDVGSISATEASGLVSPLQKATFYVEKARMRDMFKFGSVYSEKEEVIREVASPEGPKVSPVQEATKDLALVGIAWSDEPDAMIEDTSIQKIHFVKRGQMIKGKVKVEAIFRDRVVLSFEGEEIEIR